MKSSFCAALAAVLISWDASAADMGIVGDSVAGETRLGPPVAWSSGQGYGAIVAKRIGLSEVNVAASGAFTSAMAAQWEAILSRSPLPSCVIYAPGENDIGVTDVSTYREQVHAQLSGAMMAGIAADHITILTPFIYQNAAYLSAIPPYLASLRAEAASFGIPLIDVFRLFSEYSLTRSDYPALINADGHPTAAGMLEIARQFQLPENAASCAYFPRVSIQP